MNHVLVDLSSRIINTPAEISPGVERYEDRWINHPVFVVKGDESYVTTAKFVTQFSGTPSVTSLLQTIGLPSLETPDTLHQEYLHINLEDYFSIDMCERWHTYTESHSAQSYVSEQPWGETERIPALAGFTRALLLNDPELIKSAVARLEEIM